MSEHGQEMSAPRIGALASLPLFHCLAGKSCVVVGASGAAMWKAELLAAAGAKVERLTDTWSAKDLEKVSIAVADLPDREAEAFADAARAAGAIVNIIDQPDRSDFHFGVIVNRSPLVIGISTGGAAPMLGQTIRARVESFLPPGLSGWAEAAKRWRLRLKERIPDYRQRRFFWQRFVAAAWGQPESVPGDRDFEALLALDPERKGRVTLVGAGPGEPGLLTLNAVRALQAATVILYDNLVGPDILELARREARRIPVGKTGHGPSCRQSEINALMVELALSGEHVVRLKGGDPLIFGRAAEELSACRAAGIEASVIPGISAAQGAASSLLLSLTERRHARRVQFLTGHSTGGKLPSDIDWTSVADRMVTSVLYMPRKTLDDFVRIALRKGLDPATPAIAIASATLPGEDYVAGAVTEIGALARELPAGAPVTVLIGWVCRHYVPFACAPFRLPEALAS